MRFGPVPLDQAEGAILAHSQPLPKGRLRKGKRLDGSDIAALRAAGLARVTVARLDPGDMDEDAAAMALAQALVPDPATACLELQPVGTGRVNVLATRAGVARISAPQVHAVNAADPAITLATVPEWQRMEPGGMVATVKIIAYAVPGSVVRQACVAACGPAQDGAMALCPPVIRRAVLIETIVGNPAGDWAGDRGGETGGGAQGGASAKGRRVTAARLDRLGVTLAPPVCVPHQERELAKALHLAVRSPTARQEEEIGLILVLTGSATSDIGDVAPQAVRQAGGTVAHFGMPVDPGNLLFVGSLHGCPVVGLPGCARSPALNGADWVMERLICGVPVDGATIMQMGVGGLLKEAPSRPRPRRQTG
ncbi:MAG: molybdopterin-binding protein [Pararhodobacter sp.]|nr:molybdopterin-binding protein [Pararhodobacter sp.]